MITLQEDRLKVWLWLLCMVLLGEGPSTVPNGLRYYYIIDPWIVLSCSITTQHLILINLLNNQKVIYHANSGVNRTNG